MTGLSLAAEWLDADDVSTPELRATWARVAISVGSQPSTLIRDRSGNLRDGIYAPAYPLAEWLAFNWWIVVSPAAITRRSQPKLADAGQGFPWPNLAFIAERDAILVEQSPVRNYLDRVERLGSIREILDREETVHELRVFVQNVVDRLHQLGIQDTPLQREWAWLAELTPEEAEFSQIAGSLGHDPRNIDDSLADAILRAAEAIQDADILLDLVQGSWADSLETDASWVRAGIGALDRHAASSARTSEIEALRSDLATIDGHEPGELDLEQPWELGFARARRVREIAGFGAMEPLPIHEFVATVEVQGEPSVGIDGVGRASGAIRLAVPGNRPQDNLNFSAARMLSRGLFMPNARAQVVSRTRSVQDRVERAFAAELLAPAEGIQERLGGNFTPRSIAAVAATYGVSTMVIEHQVENRHLLN
jgi:hypothetical protein